MAYEKFSAEQLVRLEDRLRTIAEHLKEIRQLTERAPGGAIELQLSSFQPYLKRLERLTFNALAKARHDVYEAAITAEKQESYSVRKKRT